MMKVLSAQSGGVILFLWMLYHNDRSYYRTIMFNSQRAFYLVFVIGGSVSVFGLRVLYSSLTKAVPPEELKSELPKSCTRMWQKNQMKQEEQER